MNKLIVLGVLLASFTIVSCSNNNNVTSTDDPELSGEGGVAFTFTSSNRAKGYSTVQYKAEGDSFPEPTNVRVLVRRYSGSSLVFNTLGDVQVPTDTTLILTVPVSDGYQIDAFSYVDSTSSYKYILKFDQKTNISVSADSITQVSLTLEGIYPEFTIPDSVDKGDQFSVSVGIDKFGNAPRRQFLAYISPDTTYFDNLIQSLSNRTNASSYGLENLATWLLSESEIEGKDIYFRTNFILTPDDYYKVDENRNFPFRYNYPNPFIERDTLKTFIRIPEGGIGVDVTY